MAACTLKADRRVFRRVGFTLTELMVAVLILIVVIVATSRIFGTVSRVTGVGQAVAAVLQEASAIERQLRADFERLSSEGFLVIRSVAVPNNIRATSTGGPLINPMLEPDEFVRADQLLFFTQGVDTVQTYSDLALFGFGTTRTGQGSASRVYYGHAFQVAGGPPAERISEDIVHAIDPELIGGKPIVPWWFGEPPGYAVKTREFQKTRFLGGFDYVDQGSFGPVVLVQPTASKWLLARQAVVLGDDDNGLFPYAFLNSLSAKFIDDPVILYGRVDASAAELSDIRSGLVGLDWVDQRELLSGAVFYPRAERVAPSMQRVDQALTNHVLASGCSSFIVEWTYENGVGDESSDGFQGILINHSHDPPWFGAQPWFGLRVGPPEPCNSLEGTLSLQQYVNCLDPADQPETVFPQVFEGSSQEGTLLTARSTEIAGNWPGVVVYEAIFGHNHGTALDDLGEPFLPGNDDKIAFTPWPSAVRITMTLHGPGQRLEHGRTFQFVIALPKRG